MEYDWLPMTDDLYDKLMDIAKQPNRNGCSESGTGQPFRERKRWMKGLCGQAGVKHFGLHAIRHSTEASWQTTAFRRCRL